MIISAKSWFSRHTRRWLHKVQGDEARIRLCDRLRSLSAPVTLLTSVALVLGGIAAVLIWRDRESIGARLLAIFVSALYLGYWLKSGRLYHFRLDREYDRDGSPFGYWAFWMLGFLMFSALVYECIVRIVKG